MMLTVSRSLKSERFFPLCRTVLCCWIASILVAVATVGQRIQSDLRDLEGVLLCSQHFMSPT